MPVKPPPMMVRCVKCGWKVKQELLSDCPDWTEIIEQCQRCGNEDLDRTLASPLEMALPSWALRFFP